MKLFVLILLATYGNSFRLSVIHFNDFHARFEEQSRTSGVCKDENCHGGFSRMYTAIEDLMETRQNPILLNAGDNFQGTLWYNLFRWNITQLLMNTLPITAHTIGNHEFDNGIAGLVPFLKHMRAPMLVCNVDDSLEPDIQGLYNKSMVVEVGGKRIGIVGVIIQTTPVLSKSENLIFLDESESVNKEATRLVEEEGVFTVIVLSHCGYELEQAIAKKAVPQISLVVGAHSHTLLYTGTPPDGSNALGPYPTLVKRDVDGEEVLVVQASAYTRYLGDIVLDYDENGLVQSFQGKPIYLSKDIKQDEMINEVLAPYKELVDAKGRQVLGESSVFLDNSDCWTDECNIGNFLTDAMVFDYIDKADGGWTYAALAVTNSGGIRTSIPLGNITYNDMVNCQPFENTFDVGELQGKYIKEFLEQTATPYYFSQRQVNLLQLSGFKVVYDLSQPEGSRVVSVKLRCARCPEPVYEDLDLEQTYRVILISFLATGGDGYKVFADHFQNRQIGNNDMEVLERYLAANSPIEAQKEGRMTFKGEFAKAKLYRG